MLTSIYLIAITAEAMSGALAAGRRNMDLFGVAVVAFFTALGGGTVRDILLGNFPVTWTQHPRYIYMAIAGGLITIVIARLIRHLHQLFLVLDAIGLVAFTVIGCNVALQLGYDTVVVVMSGITTGIFGGILRDIMCNRTPPGVASRTLRQCFPGCGFALCVVTWPGSRREYNAACRVQPGSAAAYGCYSLAIVAAGVQVFAGPVGVMGAVTATAARSPKTAMLILASKPAPCWQR